MRRFFSLFSLLIIILVSSSEVFATPTQQASYISLRNRTATSVDIRWVNGDGGYRLVVMSEATITGAPSEYTSYTGNTIYGSGDPVAGGYAVYSGTDRRVSVTGLTPNTTYYVRIFEYDSATEYLTTTTTANPRSFTTLYATPDAPTAITLDERGVDYFIMSWTAPSSSYDGFEIDVSGASDFSTHNSPYDDFEMADVGNITDWYIDNMTPAEDHYFRIRTYYGLYYSPWAVFGSNPVWTLDTEPAADGTCGTISAYDQTTMTMDWTAPTGGADGYLVYMDDATLAGGTTAITDFDDFDGASVGGANSDYSAGANGSPNAYTAGTVAHVQNAAGTSVSVTGLTPGTDYYFNVDPYNNGGGLDVTSNYEPDGFQCGPYPTISSDLADPTGFDFTSYGVSSLIFRWDPVADAEYYIVVIKPESDFDASDNHPVDGTTYTFSGPATMTDCTGGNLYDYTNADAWSGLAGTASSTAQAFRFNSVGTCLYGGKYFVGLYNLNSNTRYYFRVYAVNQDASPGSENYSNPATGDRWTLFDTKANGSIVSNVDASIDDCTTGDVLVSWTGGNALPDPDNPLGTDATRYLVVARPAASQRADYSGLIVDGFDYSSMANPAWGSAHQLDANRRIVYDGIGSSVVVSGLTPGSEYSFDVYVYASNYTSSFCNVCGSHNYTALAPLFPSGTYATIIVPEAVPTAPSGAINITVTADSPNTLDLSWSSVAGADGYFLVGTSGATAPNPTPDPECTYVYDYGTLDQYSTGYEIATGMYVLGYYSSGTTSTSITNLVANTVYSFSLWTYNGDDYDASGELGLFGSGYNTNYSTSFISGTRTTLATNPSCQSTIAVTGPTDNSLDLDLTACGATDNFMVLMHTAAITDQPVDGTSTYPNVAVANGGSVAYTSNLFPSGTAYVVYNNTAATKTITVTGLSPATRYYVELFDYNGAIASGAENFAVPGDTDDGWTLATEPTQQAEFLANNSLTFTNVQSNQMRVNWNPAIGGPYYLLLATQGDVPVPSQHPVDATAYTADTDYLAHGGSFLTLDGTPWYVMYVGTGSLVDITNMTAEVEYSFMLYSANWDGTNTPTWNYLTSPDPDWAKRYTLSPEPAANVTLTITGRTTTTMDLDVNSTVSNDPEYVVVYARVGGAVAGNPVDGEAQPIGLYTDWTGTAIGVGGGDKIVGVFDFTGGPGAQSFTVTNLDPDTHYYFEAWGFNAVPGEGSTANYNMTSATDDNWTFATEPAGFVAGDVVLSNGSIIVDWSAYAGTADNFLVVAVSGNLGSAETTDPTDGVGYSAGNSDWTAATAYNTGRIVYNGSGTSVTITNVDFARRYHVSVWPYNGSNALSYNYSPDEGVASIWSWDNDPADAAPFTVTPQTGGTVLQISDFRSGVTNADLYILLASEVGTPTATLPNKGENLVSDLSVDIPYNNLWFNYSTAPNSLNGNKVLCVLYQTSPVSFPINIIGLNPCTEYYFTVYTFNAGVGSGATGAPIDDVNNFTSNPVSASGTNYAASPSTPATALAFSNASTDETASVRQYDVSWTASTTGDYYLVVAKEGGTSTTWTPADGTSYSANANYGSGYNTTDGYVVYSGSGTSFTFIAENSNKYATEYAFTVYTYNECGIGAVSRNYWIGSSATGSDHILALLPTSSPTALTPAVGVYTDTDDESSLNLSWTGGGNRYIVLAEKDVDPSTNPVNGTTYVGNSDFDAAPSLGTAKVVYTGTSTNISVSGLDPHGEYHFSVYSYNDQNNTPAQVFGSENYKIPGVINTRHAITRDPLIWENTDVASATGVQETQATITWDVAYKNDGSIANTTVDGYIVVVRDGASAPTGSPVDGSTYASGSVNMYTNGLGDGYVCYVGTGNSFTLTGLNTLSQYTVRVYSFANAGINEATNYSEGMTVTDAGNQEYEEITFSTLAPDPIAAPTALSFGTRNPTDMVVNWNMTGTGSANAIVLYSTAPFVTTVDEPVQGVGYTAGNTIGSATVAYAGASAGADNTTITGLTADVPYYVRVYGYNQSGSTGYNYYPLVGTAYVAGTHTTLDNEPAGAPTALGVAGNDGSGTVDLSWTPGSNTLLYVTTGGAPSAPVDGTTYTSGYAYKGSGSSLTGYAVTAGNTYTMYAYSYNGVNYASAADASGPIANEGSENYYGTPGTYSFTALDSEPTAPSAVVFGTRTVNSMQVSWTGSGADMYLVLRNISAPTGTPTDGTTYTAGGTIGTDDIVYVGSGTTITDGSLLSDTPYFYSVFAYNTAGGGSENYNASSADGDHTTLDVEPSAASGITTDATSEYTLDISWNNNGAGYVLVFANEGSAVTASAVDGTTYSGASASYSGANQLVYQGTGNSFQMTNLSDGTDYHFKVYTYNGTNYVGAEGSENYAAGQTHMATTDAAGGTATQVVVTSSPANAVSGANFNVTVELQDATNFATTHPSNVAVDILDPSNNVVGSGTITSGNSSVVITCSYTNANGENDVTFNTDNDASLTEDSFTMDILATDPSTGPSNLVLTATSGTTIRVQWDLGTDNDGTAVYCRYNTANNVTPTDGQSAPTPSLSYTSSPNSQLVYASSGNDITISNLATRTLYYVKLFGYTGVYADGTANFNTASPIESSVRTRRSKVATPGGEISDFDFEVNGVQPNPASDRISFSISSYVEMPYTISIYTLDGELVANVVNGQVIPVGDRIFNVPLENFASGTYLLQISTDTQAAVQQFVIIK